VDYKNFGGEANQGAAADETKTIEEIGGYVYARQALGEQVTLNAGLRLDHNSAYGDILAPFGGATYQPVEATTLKASVSRGFRSPTVQELYVFSPNPNLNPETVLNYELTLQQKLGGRARVELTPYLLTGDNLIQTEGQFPNVQRINSGAFTNRGVELAGTYLATDRLTLRGNYSYLDLDQPVLAAPRQQINLNGHYRFNRLGLYMALQHIDQLYTSVMAEEATQNYTLLDVRVSYKMTDFLRLHASANNLLDQEYQINNGYPMPGINFFGGLRVNFGGDEKN
jgi:iron complex outermembrane receptor protein